VPAGKWISEWVALHRFRRRSISNPLQSAATFPFWKAALSNPPDADGNPCEWRFRQNKSAQYDQKNAAGTSFHSVKNKKYVNE
jgi:hypothetical protein